MIRHRPRLALESALAGALVLVALGCSSTGARSDMVVLETPKFG